MLYNVVRYLTEAPQHVVLGAHYLQHAPRTTVQDASWKSGYIALFCTPPQGSRQSCV